MAASVSSFFTPGVVFLMALVVAVAAIVVLIFVERRLSKKVNVKKEAEETYFQREIRTVRAQQDPKKSLTELDRVARDFFEEKHGVSKDVSYSDLLISFQKSGKDQVVDFCKGMQEILYSGEKLNEKKLKHLQKSLETFIEGEIAERKLKGTEKKESFWKKELELDGIKKIFGGKEEKKGDTESRRKEEENKWSGLSGEKVKASEVGEKKVEHEVTVNEIEEAEIKKPDEIIEELPEDSRDKEMELQEIPRIEKPVIVPYKELNIKFKKVKKKKRSHKHSSVESVDNLDRLKVKIKDRKKLWAFQGVANAPRKSAERRGSNDRLKESKSA